MNEFSILSDHLDFYNGKAHLKNKTGNINIYGSNGIIGTIDKSLYENGIVIGRVGAYCGSVFNIKSGFWATDNTIIAVPKTNVDQDFFYFLLKFLRLENLAGGAAQPLLTQNVLRRIKVKVPNFLLQRKIASILSAYDDLIEVNLQRIKLLEEAAELIYKEWFVNYRFPVYESTRFVDGIPEGWETLNIKEILEFYIGGGWGNDVPDFEFSKPAYVIRGTDFESLRNGMSKNIPLRFHKYSNIKSRVIQNGDIVFEVSGGSKDQPVGRSMIVTSSLLNSLSKDAICASFCKLLRVKEAKLSSFLFLSLKNAYLNNLLRPFVKLSASNIMNFAFEEFIIDFKLIVPDPALLIEFSSQVEPLLDQMYLLSSLNGALAEARDLLLSKLMSGEIEV